MTSKEKLFCSHYLALHCAEEAAKRAGYKPEECKKAHLLLRREDIRRHLKALDKESDAVSLTKSAIRGLERLAFSTERGIMELLRGEEKPSDVDLFSVSEIKRNEKGTLEIKFFDRIRALQTLYEIGRTLDETASVPFFEALNNTVSQENDDGV